MNAKNASAQKNRERGSTLFFVAAGLVAFIGLMGIAIDLVALYVGKSEAQRSADAAALAGATVFVSSSCITTGTCATAEALATNQAISVGQANKVGGAAPTIAAGNVTYDLSHAGDPLVTVAVNATLPTFFMKIFGVNTANISATATAEAFRPTGASGPALCVSCLKPFLVPNCDPSHTGTPNPQCTGGGKNSDGNVGGKFINADGSIANPGTYPTGVVGQPWQLHTGGPKDGTPSHWYELAMGGQSKSVFENNVQFCNTNVLITCGTTLPVLDGNAVGPNGHAVCSLINYTSSNAQSCTSTDTVTVNAGSTPPWTITAGSGNPYFPAGSQITQSASLVTVAVYDGHTLNPGKDSISVVGYLQLFIKGITHNGNSDAIDAVILNVSTCGAGGGSCGTNGGSGQGTGGTVAGGGGGFVPVRLVHP